MIFEWDAAKSRQTLERRELDFAYATRVFADPMRLERIDRRHDYGEERRQTIGEIDGKTFLVAFTYRRDAVRIISARRTNIYEERAYREGKAWR